MTFRFYFSDNNKLKVYLMSSLTIFEKGDYKPVSVAFRTHGIAALEEISKFQEHFGIYDTDTTINSIRDAIIANYLGYDLLNMDKHGFDAKKSKSNIINK